MQDSKGERTLTLTAGTRAFRELNADIRAVLETENAVCVENVNGQRYIGTGLDAGKSVMLYGTPGNDMGAYLNGGKIEVFGNGQEAVGNTMNGGEIVLHGHVGDTLGYAMRDGAVFVEKRAGSRAGIHMKEFEHMHPVVVIGGVAGAFLGEYMAGGTLIVLGLGNPQALPLIGAHCATGMHGGRIFLRGAFPQENISEHIAVRELTADDRAELERHVNTYCAYFGADKTEILDTPFHKLEPTTARPYANLYTPN